MEHRLMSRSRRARDLEDESSLPSWFSPWGAAALCFVALAMAQASLVGIRWLSVALSLLGGSIAVLGARKTRANRLLRDQVWFAVSGALSGLIPLLIFFAPGVLNGRWAIDKTIAKPDPNQLTVVLRNKALEKGRPLSKDETVDAATEAIRQDNAVAFIDSVKTGHVPGKGSVPYLLVHFKVVNSVQGQSISLEGFTEYPPVLCDGAGHALAFVEQRFKQIKDKTVVFVEWSGRQSVEIPPRGAQEVMLIFESPLTADPLELQISSAAWGRQGACRFRIAGIDPDREMTR
jgi:hypothetical protein